MCVWECSKPEEKAAPIVPGSIVDDDDDAIGAGMDHHQHQLILRPPVPVDPQNDIYRCDKCLSLGSIYSILFLEVRSASTLPSN